jgi:glycosyltransferase involved in cell wall biosynthesis
MTDLPQVMIVSHHFVLPSCRIAAGRDGPGRLRGLYYGPAFKLGMRRSEVVLGISHYLADGLVRELGADPDKVVAMPLGVVPPATPPTLEGRTPTVLYVGTLYAYKDVDVAIRAFADARPGLPDGARLVVVGKDPDGTQVGRLRSIATASGVAHEVDVAGVVTDEQLEALYSTASVLVLPSRYEGFGLPVAEAMSRGVPVVVADSTSLPEVAGDGGIAVPTGDVAAFAAAITALLTDEPRRLELARKGVVRAAELTWDRTAAILADAIHRAAGR